ncbi:extracellular solute-binding protein [Pseudoflavonifractor sp. 524-17]|uniref:ABC transporter substrate-binding protein n=1 Tax=Pseudoflavonifractor sp. 524-17 TaxID=2304577 RepID=UPI00137A8742|nr:extracellular solute-binding protein [Pseudoflavonifractor sp. 524-17]NCE65497.1 extracellular solute-binding protein [Pseudoflavonifractor sp. 524-17]
MKKRVRSAATVCLAALAVLPLASCGHEDPQNLLPQEVREERIVNFFSPMEKTDPNAENVARTASDLTVAMAEEKLGVTVAYMTYTAESYQDKTYDDVTLDRARSNMDDLYLLNPDTVLKLGAEGKLADLSGLDSAKNLREIVRTANTVDGKLVAIPQEVVAYGLFVNKDMFDQYHLALPETPEEFLECCRVFKENGVQTPVGANRWWLETFVFAQAYADLYNGGNTQAEIEALNSGEARYSDYMRPGFEFLQELINQGYIDPEKALVSEAIEGEGADFLAQKTPIVMAYWGAANTETAYGKTDFEMQVIGFPSSRGQMPVMPMTGFAVGVNAEHKEDAIQVLDVITSDEALQVYAETNRVISPSKNVEVECVPALKPLNDRIQEGVYVLGSNAGMNVEQWGNTCLIVRELLGGATVDECMASFDALQDAALAGK